jgi:nucleoside-diphosphate-sugar epimerase
VRVLVTGGTGFIGSHAVGALQRDGHAVRVLARDAARVPLVLGPLGLEADEVATGDMTDPGAVAAALDGCDAVVHCAAEIGVGGGRGPSGTANLDGARLVIGRAVAAGLDPVVYTSSITVHLPCEDPVVTLQTALAEPLSAYGAQKVAVEEFVQGLQADGAPVTTLVVSGVYGPVSPHLDGSFAALTGSLAAGMVAPDSGLGVVDVRDVATVVARSLEPGRGPRRYLVTGNFVTWEQWTHVLSEAVGRPVPFTLVSDDDMIGLGRKFDELRDGGAEGLPPLSVEAAVVMASGRPADDSATRRELGVRYRPTVETFRDTLEWLRATGHLGG